ncbi:MAG: ECF-type sigma factor, partial [Planctomycetota bacterium]
SGAPSFGPTDLVNETFLKFSQLKDFGVIKDVEHFFALFSSMMRQVFVDYQRNKNTWKKGGRVGIFVLSQISTQLESQIGSLVELDDCMRCLSKRHPKAAQALDMQIFLRLKVNEIAVALDMTLSQTEKQLRLAKATMVSLMQGA